VDAQKYIAAARAPSHAIAIAAAYGAYVILRIIAGAEFFVYGRISPVINVDYVVFRTAEMLQTLLLIAVALGFFAGLSERVRSPAVGNPKVSSSPGS
jgi:hypothetical protein